MGHNLSKLRKDRQIQAITIFFAILAVTPLIAFQQTYILWVIILTMFYAILALSWNILIGYTQLLSFAHPGLLAMGAYFSAFFIKYTGAPPIIGLLISTVLVTVAGFLLGLVCLRLRGIYLALTTWGLSGAVQRILISEYNITGGLTGLATKFLLPVSPLIAPQHYYYIVLAILAACAMTIYKIINSKYGLYLKAIGDDEEAASACGVNIVRMRILAFTLSSVWVGLAGAFYAHLVGRVSPALADFSIMMFVIASTILGGLGTFFGPLLGAFIMWPVSEVIRAHSAGLQMIILSVIILISLKFFKNGLVGALSISHHRTRRELSVSP